MTRYGRVLRAPHVGPLLAATFLSRLPIGVNALAAVLYLQAERGSFAIAGAVAGAIALGAGIGAPAAGRLVDLLGARRVLVPVGVAHAVTLAGLVLAQERGASVAALIGCGLLIGVSVPPTGAVVRSLWPRLVEPEVVRAAYALDTVMIEVVFIVGPVVTGVLAATTTAAAALVLSAAGAVVGSLLFVVALPAGMADAASGPSVRGRWGALASPGIRTLIYATFPVGVALGATEVVLPAFSARTAGDTSHAGLLLALWSLGSLGGGLLYGAVPPRATVERVHLTMAVLFPLTLLPMLLAGSVATMALLVLPAGVCVAPLIATRNELVGRVAPAGSATEAYTWPVTALVAGIAVGAASAGSIVEAADWRAATLMAAGLGVLGSATAILRRRTLAAPRPAVGGRSMS